MCAAMAQWFAFNGEEKQQVTAMNGSSNLWQGIAKAQEQCHIVRQREEKLNRKQGIPGVVHVHEKHPVVVENWENGTPKRRQHQRWNSAQRARSRRPGVRGAMRAAAPGEVSQVLGHQENPGKHLK